MIVDLAASRRGMLSAGGGSVVPRPRSQRHRVVIDELTAAHAWRAGSDSLCAAKAAERRATVLHTVRREEGGGGPHCLTLFASQAMLRGPICHELRAEDLGLCCPSSMLHPYPPSPGVRLISS